MNRRSGVLFPALVISGISGLLFAVSGAPSPSLAATKDEGGYEALVRLFHEWRTFQKPRIVDGVPDYSAAAMERQKRQLPELQRRLSQIDHRSWPPSERVDYEIVRAEMNGLEFDHRVLRPWSRNPCFYAVTTPEESDTPSKEGPAFAGAIPLFFVQLPLPAEEVAPFRTRLRAIPKILADARRNLVEDARDLWLLGIRVQRDQSSILAALAKRLAPHHPELAADAERARQAVDEFRAWLEGKAPEKTAPSGVGVANYDWYLRNVHLVPFTWQEEATLIRRELARAVAQLKLEENRNRALPRLSPATTPEEWQRRFGDDVTAYMSFLRDKEVVTMRDYMEPALRARLGAFVPPDRRDFFDQVQFRSPLVMLCHMNHWFDLARMKSEPHPSPIRQGPLLYNIWDGRAEGLATAMEEMMMSTGLHDTRPRARELVYVMVANRAARGLAGLLVQSRELTVAQAVRFAHDFTPNGWLRADGQLVWGEQQNYLEQPGYGTSYITGKAQIERLLADRSRQLGEGFTLKRFMDDLNASGMIPVSLIRWEMTGLYDEIRGLNGST